MKRAALALLGLVALLWARSRTRRPAQDDAPAGATSSAVAALVVRHPWLSLVAVLGVLALGGFATVVAGIVPIKASSGHWPITEWFLHFAMRRSIATHSITIDPPPLDDLALVVRGAGHYEIGCRPCHGAPGTPVPKIAAAMTPRPPELSGRMRQWQPEDLFYIVKHGVKFTGMPAWPAQSRDDEVWAMVAFLRRMPQMEPQEYQDLSGDRRLANLGLTRGLTPGLTPSLPAMVASTCARCHGVDGRGRGVAAYPVVAGQRPQYLANALRAYATAERSSGIMGPIAAALPEDALAEIAEYYSGLPGLRRGDSPERPPDGLATTSSRLRGQSIARGGIPQKKIPACVECHGPAEPPRNPAYPILGGQYADYLVQQLELFQGRRRGGSAYARLMHAFVDRLSTEDIRDVALYYAAGMDTADR